jgi:hypothetical protein
VVSGYGPASALYAIDHFATNSYLYASWLIESESAFILAALLPFLIPALRPAWFSSRTILPLGLYVLIIFISYALYLVFNEWWFLRFFLPVFPLLFLCFATPVAWITRRAPALIAIPALVGIMALLASRWTGFAVDRGVLEIGMGEQRTVTVADHITSALPANAIFIALHHAGPIRLYSGRPSVRFDYFAPPRLASAIAWLRDNGYRPYILLENWEEKDFRRRFAGQGPIGELRIPVIAELRDTISVRLYDPLPDRPSYADPIVGPPVARCADTKWGRR